MSSIRGYEHDMYMLEKEKVRALVNIVSLLNNIDKKLDKFSEYYDILVNEKTREEMRSNFRHEDEEA